MTSGASNIMNLQEQHRIRDSLSDATFMHTTHYATLTPCKIVSLASNKGDRRAGDRSSGHRAYVGRAIYEILHADDDKSVK